MRKSAVRRALPGGLGVGGTSTPLDVLRHSGCAPAWCGAAGLQMELVSGTRRAPTPCPPYPRV